MNDAYRENYSAVNRQNLVAIYSGGYSLSCMSIGNRINELLKAAGMSQAELARQVRVSQPTINALIKGNAQGSKHLHKIAQVLGTTPAYLNGDTNDPDEGAAPIVSPEEIAEEYGLAFVPQLELGYSMGGGSVIEAYEHTGFVPFQRDWLRGLMRGAVDELFVARGEGDSMQPTMLDGDIVLIDTSQKQVTQQDRIWAISYGELGMIKRLRRQPDGNFLIISDNSTVQPFTAVDEEMHVIGRVIWIGRRM